MWSNNFHFWHSERLNVPWSTANSMLASDVFWSEISSWKWILCAPLWRPQTLFRRSSTSDTWPSLHRAYLCAISNPAFFVLGRLTMKQATVSSFIGCFAATRSIACPVHQSSPHLWVVVLHLRRSSQTFALVPRRTCPFSSFHQSNGIRTCPFHVAQLSCEN